MKKRASDVANELHILHMYFTSQALTTLYLEGTTNSICTAVWQPGFRICTDLSGSGSSIFALCGSRSGSPECKFNS